MTTNMMLEFLKAAENAWNDLSVIDKSLAKMELQHFANYVGEYEITQHDMAFIFGYLYARMNKEKL